jgi:hypothetical protein
MAEPISIGRRTMLDQRSYVETVRRRPGSLRELKVIGFNAIIDMRQVSYLLRTMTYIR